MLGSRALLWFLFVVCFFFFKFHLMKFMWTFHDIYKAKPKTTREQSCLRVSVFTFRSGRGSLSNRARYRSGEPRSLVWKDQTLSTSPVDPLVLPNPFDTSNLTSASPYTVQALQVLSGSQALCTYRGKVCWGMLPQKGHGFTSSPSHVPIEALKCQIMKDTLNL